MTFFIKEAQTSSGPVRLTIHISVEGPDKDEARQAEEIVLLQVAKSMAQVGA